jgi:hypothetical protein
MSQNNDDSQIMVSFRLPADAIATIEARALKAGMSRSEYLRARAISAPDASAGVNLESLLRHLIYIATRTHIAVYSIAETAGTLSREQLQRIYDDARTEGLEYMAELSGAMAEVQPGIAPKAETAPPAGE